MLVKSAFKIFTSNNQNKFLCLAEIILAMEEKVLPLIFLNLCGEMLYVILQRLDAQNISPEKTSKVIQDILSTMLNDQFLEELFKPQKMYTRLAMQSVFEKLVHSSIMRLNSNSMNKLYDLMLMVFKYQVVNCQDPADIVLVTLNHLDAVKECAKPYPELLTRVKNLYSLLKSNYSELHHKDYECLYKCIDVFLENLNVRVSVLMKLGLQLPSGEIVMAKNCQVHSLSESEEECQQSLPFSCFDVEGDRNFTLGINIYTQSTISESPKSMQPQPFTSVNAANNAHDFKEIEELSLLTRLIRKNTPSNCISEIMLVSPNEEENCELLDKGASRESCSFINIDASQVSKQNLEKICKELVVNVEEKQKTDILELLDTLETNNT